MFKMIDVIKYTNFSLPMTGLKPVTQVGYKSDL